MAKKIPVSQSQQPLAVNPFAGLALEGLPPGSEAPQAPNPAGTGPRGRVVLRREKAHRGGKTVVVVDGFDPALSDEAIREFARRARQACGCGGTVSGRAIELQGDDSARVRRFFELEGFRVAGV